MGLFRDIAPPSSGAGFGERVDWAAARDPLGHRTHLVLAFIAMVMMPLSSSAATIGSTVLFIYAAIRSPTIHRCWKGLFGIPSVLLLLGFVGWSALTALWSTDPGHAMEMLRRTRYILLLPALLPLMRHAPLLLAAVCFGVLLQNLIQFGYYLSIPGYFGGGLDQHPGATSVWFIFVAVLLLGPYDLRCLPPTPRRILFLAPVLGVVVSSARSVLLGMSATLAVLTGWLLLRRPAGWRMMTFMAGTGLAILCISSFLPGGAMANRMAAAWNESVEGATASATNDEAPASVEGTRLLWWRIGLETGQDHPLFGNGLGSAGEKISTDPRIGEIVRDGRADYYLRDDYHSLYVTTLSDLGLVGMGLLAGWLIAAGLEIRKMGALAPALYAGLIGFAIYGLFNTAFFTGRVLALPILVMSLSAHALPARSNQEDVTAVPDGLKR